MNQPAEQNDHFVQKREGKKQECAEYLQSSTTGADYYALKGLVKSLCFNRVFVCPPVNLQEVTKTEEDDDEGKLTEFFLLMEQER